MIQPQDLRDKIARFAGELAAIDGSTICRFGAFISHLLNVAHYIQPQDYEGNYSEEWENEIYAAFNAARDAEQ